MATIIPDTIPNKANSCEKSVSVLLKNLPKDCTIFYEPKINNKTPDFVVVSPRFGVLVIEVKSWSISYIEEVNNDTVHVNHQGKIESRPNPNKQSSQYMFDLMNILKKSKRSNLIMDNDNLKPRLVFPVNYLVVMPNMAINDIEKNNLNCFFKRENYEFKEGIDILRSLTPKKMEYFFLNKFTKKWSFPNLTKKQIEVIKNTIHPIVKISKNSTDKNTSFSKKTESFDTVVDYEKIVQSHIPKDIYDITQKSFNELLEKSRDLQEKINNRKKKTHELKNQIRIAELLIKNEPSKIDLIETSEESEITKSQKTIINNCNSIANYAKNISKQTQFEKIDSAMASFEKIKLHAVTSGLKLEYIKELKILLTDMNKMTLSRAKFDSIALLLNPQKNDRPTEEKASLITYQTD